MSDPVVAPVTPEPQAPPPAQEPNRIQQRIAQLVGTAKEQGERAEAYASQVQELRTQLLATQEELAGIRGQIVQPPPPDPSSVVPSSSGADWRKELAVAVKEAVGPVISGLRQERAVDQLRSAQRQSFERAISEIPDLANPQSDLYRAADQILSSMPKLQVLPNAPELAAFIARGLIGSAAPTQPSPVQRTVAGAPPAVSRGPGPQTSPQDQLKALETEYTQNLEAGRTTEDQAVSMQAWVKRGQIADRIEALKKQFNLQ